MERRNHLRPAMLRTSDGIESGQATNAFVAGILKVQPDQTG